MIWFSAESSLMWTSPSACGPIAIPATRNTATSGILIFCASSPASVPIASISPHDSSVCFAISMEADASIVGLPSLTGRGCDRASVVNVDDPARLRMEDHRAAIDDRIVMFGHPVLLRHRIRLIGPGPQLAADRDLVVIAIDRPGLAINIGPKRLALLVGHDKAGGDGSALDGTGNSPCDGIVLRQSGVRGHQRADG